MAQPVGHSYVLDVSALPEEVVLWSSEDIVGMLNTGFQLRNHLTSTAKTQSTLPIDIHVQDYVEAVYSTLVSSILSDVVYLWNNTPSRPALEVLPQLEVRSHITHGPVDYVLRARGNNDIWLVVEVKRLTWKNFFRTNSATNTRTSKWSHARKQQSFCNSNL